MESIFKNIKLEGDRTIWGVVFFLGLFSILIVYSAAGISEIFKHIIRLSIGVGCMYLVHQLKFKYFSRLGVLGFWMSIILLICALLFGPSINAANRWLDIAGHSFQPSDIAKLSIILFVARQLSKQRDFLNEFKGVIWYVLAPIILIIGYCIIIPISILIK